MIEAISVVVPTFNRAGTIARALDSITCQTWTEGIEIVVTDNASSDGTLLAVDEWHHRHPDVSLTVLRNDKNVGPVDNWARGIRAASFPWLKMLWSDDTLLPAALQDLATACERWDAVLSVGAGVLHTHDGTATVQNDDDGGLFSAEDFLRSWLTREGRFSQSATAALIRTDLALAGLAAADSLGECRERGIGPDLTLLYWSLFRGERAVHTGSTVCEYWSDASGVGDEPSITSIASGDDLRVCYDAALACLLDETPAPIPKDLLTVLQHRSFEARITRHRLAPLLVSPRPSGPLLLESARRLWQRARR